MRRLIIEVRGGTVQTVYWEGTPHCLLSGGRVVLRDWDNIQAGDPDPLLGAPLADVVRLFCRNCGLEIEEGQSFWPWQDVGFIHEHCTTPNPTAAFCPVHRHALFRLDEQTGLCPVPDQAPRECAQYHPLHGAPEGEEE